MEAPDSNLPATAEGPQLSVGLQGEYAGCVSRLAGFVVDVVVISVSLVAINWLVPAALKPFGIPVQTCAAPTSDSELFGWVCWLTRVGLAVFTIVFTPLYYLFLWSLAGQSVGKALLGVRIVRLNGKQMSLWIALRRLVGYLLTLLTFGLGFLWVAADNRRQALHDKIAGTSVIYSWEATHNRRLVQRLRRNFRRLRSVPPVLKAPQLEEMAGRSYEGVLLTFPDLPSAMDLWTQLRTWNLEDPARVARAALVHKDSSGRIHRRQPVYTGGPKGPIPGLTTLDGKPPAERAEEVVADLSPETAVIAAIVEQEWADKLTSATVREPLVLQGPESQELQEPAQEPGA